MTLNGPNSIFYGYSWTLDTIVDHAWAQLTSLWAQLLVMLVLEACILQVCGLGTGGWGAG